jgi:hypothetical protein
VRPVGVEAHEGTIGPRPSGPSFSGRGRSG